MKLQPIGTCCAFGQWTLDCCACVFVWPFNLVPSAAKSTSKVERRSMERFCLNGNIENDGKELATLPAIIKSNKDNRQHKISAKIPAQPVMKSSLAYSIKIFHRIMVVFEWLCSNGFEFSRKKHFF